MICKSPKSYDNGKCVENCPPGKTSINNICEPCKTGCEK